jgi:hypothetical protein
MAIREAAVQRMLATIESICTIKNLGWYVIGYSSHPAIRRRVAVDREGFPHFVVLADRLSKDDALDLEERLFLAATKSKKKGLLYKKYHPDKRDDRYWRADGGNKVDRSQLVHSVYIVWWVKHG